MMRVCISQKKFGEASKYLEKAVDCGMPEANAALQRAGIAAAAGDLEGAKNILDNLLVSNRKLLRGWVLLADIAFAMDDSRLIDKCIRRMVSIEGDRGYYGSITHGRLALKQNDFRTAEEFYANAYTKAPSNMNIVKILLRLEMGLGDKEKAKQYIKVMLQRNPDDPVALSMLGSIQLLDGKEELAEDSYRHSLSSARLPMTLNDLAYIIQSQGKYEEAEKLIDEALEITDKHPSLWDTKGCVLMGMKRYDEAVAAFGRSLVIFDKMPSVHLHMAEAQLALGNTQMAEDIVKRFDGMQDELSADDREIMSRLRLELEGGTE
jgi:tetratricopeptide (TPR) repeat protein